MMRNLNVLAHGRGIVGWSCIVVTAVSLLVVGAAQATVLTWSAGGSGGWDTTATNWNAGTATFADGGVDDVIFNDAAGGTITIAANMSPASTTVSADSGTYIFTGGPIDSGMLTKSGGGRLDLISPNSFTEVYVNGGTLVLGVNVAGTAGTGTISLGDTTGDVDAKLSLNKMNVYVNPLVVRSGGTGTLTMAFNGASPSGSDWRGSMTLNRDLAITKIGDRVDTISGNISGSGGFAYEGGNDSGLTLSGVNSYTGTTSIIGGALTLTKASAYNGGAISVSGVGSTLNLYFDDAGASGLFDNAALATLLGNTTFGAGTFLAIDANTSETLSATISGDQGLRVAGAGNTVTITGANTFTGPVVIYGTAQVSSINSVSGGSASSNLGAPTTVADGAITLNIARGEAWAAGTLKYTGNGETTDRNLVVPSQNHGYIEQAGTGLLKFTGTAEVLGANKWLGLKGSTAGTGEISGVISGPGRVNKNGTGTWTLSGDNTYTGTTDVNQGTLIINGDQSAATGAVTVASGATLGGSGALGGAITVNGGGILEPGESPGTLHGVDMVFASGAILNWEYDAIDSDLVALSGNLTITDDAATTINVIGADPLAFGTPLFTYGGILTGANNGDVLSWTVNGTPAGVFAQVAASGGQIILVPEPASLVLLGLGAFGLVARRKRST